jgi:hypothetical protein
MFMKQNLMLFGLMLLFVVSSCKRETALDPTDLSSQSPASGEANAAEGRLGQCRLVYDDRDGVFGNTFHYNNRGLVDQQVDEYYDGYPDVYTFTYDNFNRLKTCHGLFNSNGFAIDVKYQYQGGRLVHETVYQAGTTNILNEISTTYNFLGQVIRRGSTIRNEYCTITWGLFGNYPLINYYIDGALYMKEEFTYRQFNRNPLKTLAGFPFMLPRYDFEFSNWWETSDKFTVYEDGIPSVIVDYDPNTAVMDLGPQQYLHSVTNFDRATQQNTVGTFEYENCGGANNDHMREHRNISPVKGSKAAAIAKFKKALYLGVSFNIKDEIKKLKAN